MASPTPVSGEKARAATATAKAKAAATRAKEREKALAAKKAAAADLAAVRRVERSIARRRAKFADETPTALVRRARRMAKILEQTYPDAYCELDFENPLQLLTATILSAQCTDVRVNMVTPALFARYPDAEALAAADRGELETIIQSTGFFRAKANSLLGMSAALCANFDGEVPGRLEDLVTLPGVGRKTANVVLGNAFDVPGITVDTHFGRLSRRFGWTTQDDPVKVEHIVGALFPRKEWTLLSHRMIFHGRRICFSQRPACGACPLAELCPSYGDGPTDPVVAARLVKTGPRVEAASGTVEVVEELTSDERP